MNDTIKELKSVLLPKVLKPGAEISKCDIKYLTAPGENYGSILLSVDISIKDTSNETNRETVRAVAKTVPKNEFIKNFFMSSLTFRKELHFYSTVIPTLRAFQAVHGIENLINFTADFYGGRLSLDSQAEQADKDAVILMENLRVKDYRILDRTIGFDFDTACLIIKDIALLHAVPIAIKIKRPDIFERQIRPSLEFADVFCQSMTQEMQDKSIEDIISTAQENPRCLPYLTALKKKCEDCYRILGGPDTGREPFATITHNDLWVNNVMIKFGENGKPIHNKIIDYQFINFGSPGKDVIFFIFNSVQNKVIQTKYVQLLQSYHDTFIAMLKQLKVDTEGFSFNTFLEELDYAASNTFVVGQCFAMLRPIFAGEEHASDVESLSNDNILQSKEPSPGHKEKLYYLVEEFAKRKWI